MLPRGLAALILILAACGDSNVEPTATTPTEVPATTAPTATTSIATSTSLTVAGAGEFTVTSPAVADARLSPEFMCEQKVDGIESSIPIAWSNVPTGTESLAASMIHYPNPDDTAHPNSYLLVWGIPAITTAIAHGAADDGPWFLGANKDGNIVSYTSPCSPSAGSHEYTLTLYALADSTIGLPSESSVAVTWDEFSSALDAAAVIDTASITFDAVTP
jgi:phosphatidylethanolamine-binding protein (PEBP) family uncharacterized protein